MSVLFMIGVTIALMIGFLFVITFPDVLPYFRTALDALIFYLGKSMDIVWIFVPPGPVRAFMSLAIAVELTVLSYKFVMWILRKIPTSSVT